MDWDSYNSGRRGSGSIGTANDALSWAVGDMERKNKESMDAFAKANPGDEHPHAYQIFILWALTGFPMASLSYSHWYPWTRAEWLPQAHLVTFVIWAILNWGIYKFLCVIPGWLSGTLMAGVLGGLTAWITFTQSDLSMAWAGGISLGVAVVAYLFYAVLE